MSAFRIRAAATDDAEAIARVHVQAWRETYAGLMPQEIIESRSVEQRMHMWAQTLDSPSAIVFVAENEDDEIVGFAMGGEARDPRLGATGELAAINLIEEAKGRGVGRSLFEAIFAALTARGHQTVALWVLAENTRARRFYERMGGSLGASREDRRGDVVLHDVAYMWTLGA